MSILKIKHQQTLTKIASINDVANGVSQQNDTYQENSYYREDNSSACRDDDTITEDSHSAEAPVKIERDPVKIERDERILSDSEGSEIIFTGGEGG